MIYEIRVDTVDETHCVSIVAATIAEALQRARNIWCPTTVRNVQLLATVDPSRQKALAF